MNKDLTELKNRVILFVNLSHSFSEGKVFFITGVNGTFGLLKYFYVS